jgi:hypothetical protein
MHVPQYVIGIVLFAILYPLLMRVFARKYFSWLGSLIAVSMPRRWRFTASRLSARCFRRTDDGILASGVGGILRAAAGNGCRAVFVNGLP